MDVTGIYKGGWQPKKLSQKDIEKMKKNMKKVPIIKLKSDAYHLKEEQEAEKLLQELHTQENK